MCESNQNQTLPGAGPSMGEPIRERAENAKACYDKAQAIHVPAVVRDLRQRREELLHQRARIDEKLWTLNTVLGVFEG